MVAEKRSREQVRLDVLFRPARESGTVISMQEGSNVNHSTVAEEEAATTGEELTCTSMNAEPKLPKIHTHTCTNIQHYFIKRDRPLTELQAVYACPLAELHDHLRPSRLLLPPREPLASAASPEEVRRRVLVVLRRQVNGSCWGRWGQS